MHFLVFLVNAESLLHSTRPFFVNEDVQRNLDRWVPAFVKICFSMWSSLICIVDRSARQIGDQFCQLMIDYVFTFWNSAGILTGCLEKRHSYFLLFFLLRKSKLNEGRDSTLRLFIFPFSFLSWFSVSSRDVFVLLVRLSVCGSAYWSRLLLKFVFSLVIVSINEQVILLLRYAFSFKVFHKVFETSTGQRICDLFFCTKGDCVLIRELMYTNILAAKKIL